MARPAISDGETIVAARYVGSWVVNIVCPLVGSGSARGEEAVSHREQSFAAPLEMRIEVMVREGPSVLVFVSVDPVGKVALSGIGDLRHLLQAAAHAAACETGVGNPSDLYSGPLSPAVFGPGSTGSRIR